MTQGGRADAVPHPTCGRAQCDTCTTKGDSYLEGLPPFLFIIRFLVTPLPNLPVLVKFFFHYTIIVKIEIL